MVTSNRVAVVISCDLSMPFSSTFGIPMAVMKCFDSRLLHAKRRVHAGGMEAFDCFLSIRTSRSEVFLQMIDFFGSFFRGHDILIALWM